MPRVFRIGTGAIFPLWLKLVGLLFLIIFVSYSWKNYGLQNFLWFSCLGVIGSVMALWLENRMLASMMLLSMFIADEIGWGGDFIIRLLFGWHPFGATAYMFDPRLPLGGRAVSLYHFFVPAVLVWMVHKLRYDTRALALQSGFSTIVLILSLTLTNPINNINWVFGFGATAKAFVPPWLYLMGEMIFIPVVFYLPVHLLLKKLGWHRPMEIRQASDNRSL